MANECIPFYGGDDVVTVTAAANLSGCRLVTVSADRTGGGPELVAGGTGGNITVNYPSAGTKVFGVLAQDVLSGKQVACIQDGILPILCNANLSAGQVVEADASGRVIVRASGVPVGFAVDAALSGDFAQINLYEGFGP